MLAICGALIAVELDQIAYHSTVGQVTDEASPILAAALMGRSGREGMVSPIIQWLA
jgi:hypothetical protein